ncbi:MAG TPA: glutaredoxin domain-containing protein [Steroidobacteraceae bacterium]|nr:glutaredoxin domain-containing protein [Steroidobacteraceae bacterium]
MSWSRAILIVTAALLAWQFVARIDADSVTATELAQLATAMKPDDIVMYTTTDCPYCAEARVWLSANNFAFTECDAQVSARCARELEELEADGVPLLVVRGAALTAGFDIEDLAAALR